MCMELYGGTQRCMEVCTEMHEGAWRCAWRCITVCPSLPLVAPATIDLVGNNKVI